MFKERTRLVLSLLGLLFLTARTSAVEYRTLNFLVDAPSVEVGRQIGEAAERYRKELAEKWLGKEMPTWDKPCPLRVTVTGSGSGGATSFAFDNGQILERRMHIQGTLDRLLVSVLPHEVTHTVLAHHFRSPVPRWADEGGAVLCEDKQERRRHDQIIRRIVKDGRMIPLSRLFALREYPPDVMVLYAEGYSITQFLVEKRNRKTFLAFVKQGTEDDWDRALKEHYGYEKIEDLEKEWLAHLSRTAPEKTETRTSLFSRYAPAVLCALRERP
ncbi:MAG TPA: hypothetical protein VKD72_00215 [Gemmataceae bacterium]|nr:hypothetical protein [Gemmataceae bacterium]